MSQREPTLKRFPSGFVVAGLLVLSGLMWAVMFLGPLAHLTHLAGGRRLSTSGPKAIDVDGVGRCHEWTKEVRYYMIVLLGVDKPNETFMTLACPICKSSAQELPRTGDATGYHCATHGDFKVADTVFAEAKAKGYTREEWEVALEKAEQRAEQRTEPDEWPLIITDDFF